MKLSTLILISPVLLTLMNCSSSSSASKPLPTLTSPARSKAWGAPRTEQTSTGYQMTYTNPANGREKLTITGSRELMFFIYYPPHLKGTRIVNGVPTEVDEAQLWQKALVTGQTVKFYHATLPTGTKGSVFKTQGTELTDPSGNKGTYRVVAEGSNNQMQSWLSELRFSN